MNEFKLTINKKFAEDYEKKKRHEELAKLQEKYDNEEEDRSSDEESSEEEDEEGELLTADVDAKILKTISKIRAKDQSVYDTATTFFGEEDFENIVIKPKKQDSLFLKDYQRKKLLEDYANDEAKKERPVSHMEEQEQLKNELRGAFSAVSEQEDEFLVKKPKGKAEIEKEEIDYKNFLLENLSKTENARENMTEWFSGNRKNSKMNEDDQFIMDYILNRGWVEKAKKPMSYEEIIKDVVDDEESVEKMEEFEFKHNFRFEQEGAQNIVTHARDIDNSVRRKDESRKVARLTKKERQEEEKKKKIEELKRLKNLKAAEIKEKIEKLQRIANTEESKIQALDLDEDFDPEEYDKQMARVFDDEYYNADEGKPVFDDDLEDDIKDSLYGIKEKVKVNKATPGKNSEEIEKIMDEYYQLDFEDMVGDLPCRFKYRSVNAANFGLSVDDIITADDKALNSFLSLKKLAPYRPPEKEREDIKKYSKKNRLKAFYESQKVIDKEKISSKSGKLSKKSDKPEKSSKKHKGEK